MTPGFYLKPTVLAEMVPDNSAAKEEFFGPVFLLYKAKTEDDAVTLANNTEFGLGSALFTRNLERAEMLAHRIDASMVFINHGAWTAPDLPFGGVKASGYVRELGELGIHEFVNKKLIRIQEARSTSL